MGADSKNNNKKTKKGRQSSVTSILFESSQKCVCLQGKKCWVGGEGWVGDLLDVVGIGHRYREGGSRRRVFYRLCGWAQDVSRHPALSGRRLAVGWSVNKVHVLLVGGQDLDGLSLTDADLVLLECRVVLSDQHGGGDAITAAVAVLRRRGKGEEKRTEEKTTGEDAKERRRTQKRG